MSNKEKKYERNNLKYEQWEIEYLEDTWGVFTINTISRELKRSKEALIAYAEKNGLGGFLYTDEYLTTGEAGVIAGVDYTTIIYWIKHNSLKAKFRKIHKKKVYLIDPQDFKDFLKANQSKWSTLKADLSMFNGNEEWLIKKISEDKNCKYKNTNNMWTVKEEENLIKLVNKGYSNLEIAEILGRTRDSISRRRAHLISLGRLDIDSKIQDDNTVRQFVFGNWGRLSIKEIADATNRTEEQIMAMQWRYNLPSLYNIEDENLFTFIELGEMLKLSRATMRRWTNEFGLKKQELNKGKKKRLVVDIRDVLPFLEANKDNMTSTTYNRCKDILEEYFSSNKLSATA